MMFPHPVPSARLRLWFRVAGILGALLWAAAPGRAATEPAQISPAWSGPTAGEEILSLSGSWRFTIDPAVADAGDTGAWDTLAVPGNWDAQPAYANHRGTGWYRREFAVPAAWPADARLRLRFEAVYHDAEVTLNGKVLGGHRGGYTPFEFDVTDLVRRDAANVVVVRADNTFRRGAWWPWGGISREVTLRANSDLRIVVQHVNAEPAPDGGASLRLRVRVANASARDRSVVLAPVVRALGVVGSVPPAADALFSLPATELAVPAGGSAERVFETVLPPASATPWHFDHPYLHAVETVLREGDRVHHARRDRFGVRRAELRPDGLYLNGERIRGGGFNRVSDGPGTGNTEPDWLVRKDVDLMKRAGAVFSRLMHHAQAPNLLDYLDERGLLIVAEIPVWGEDDPHLTADNPTTRAWLAEMIERDHNHPSIIGWSVGNEIMNHFDYVRTMADHVRRDLDPSRFVTYVSYTAYRPQFGPANDPLTHTDAALFTTYTDKPEVYLQRVRKMRAQWPDKPVFAAEFGVKQIGAQPAATVPNFAALWAGITREPYVIGGALWTLNDYRSDYKGTPASGNREWGVVDLERRPKAAYEEARRVFAPARALEFDAARIRLTPRGADEAPSYTLRGYRLEWTARPADGGEARRGEIALPVLRPGDPAWEQPAPAPGLESVRLLAPAGYDVLDGTAFAAPAGGRAP